MSSSSNSRSETARSARAQWPPNTAAWMDEHAKKDPPVMVHPLSVHHWNVGWHRSKYPNRPFDSHYYPFDYMEKAKEHKRLTMRHQATNAPMPPIISPEQVAAYDAMIKNGVEKGHYASKSSFLARMTRLFRNKQPWATSSPEELAAAHYGVPFRTVKGGVVGMRPALAQQYKYLTGQNLPRFEGMYQDKPVRHGGPIPLQGGYLNATGFYPALEFPPGGLSPMNYEHGRKVGPKRKVIKRKVIKRKVIKRKVATKKVVRAKPATKKTKGVAKRLGVKLSKRVYSKKLKKYVSKPKREKELKRNIRKARGARK